MKTKLLVLISFFIIEITFAQLSTETPLLPLSPVEYLSVDASDLDGDGDLDLVAAPYRSGSIFWFENKDGLGNIGEAQSLSFATYSQEVRTADIDNDGDMDIFAALPSKIVWYENTDGKANFGIEHIMSNADGASSIHAVDIDGDGDMDLLTNSFNDYKTIWYENTDGKGTFLQHIVVSNSFPNVTSSSVYAADFDGDGDPDVLESYHNSAFKIVWYENIDGLGTFGAGQIIQNGDKTNTIFAGDIDGDGDLDVVAASKWSSFGYVSRLSWFENTDGIGNFGSQKIIATFDYTVDPRNVKLADIDLDGDMDLFLANYNKVTLYENLDGLGSFGQEIVLGETEDSAFTEVIIKDFNGDGNPDVIASNFWGLSWWENLMNSQTTDGDGDGFDSDVDCDDNNPAVNPDAVEVCDGIDNNCDGLIDDDDPNVIGQSIWYADTDHDDFGNSSETLTQCAQPIGYVADNTDCDDTNELIYPGAPDIPGNGIDEDCDGEDLLIWYQDSDGDSYGNPDVSMESVTQPPGYVADNTDCDDTNELIYPGAPEIPNNGIDEDCNGEDPIDGGESCANEIFGDLNLNPARSANNIFIMETPVVLIDMNTLASAGSNYTYSGSASSIKIKVKAQGRTLTVNGSKITLRPNIRYEFAGALTVSLYNRMARDKKNRSNGHWWIGLEGINICIKEEIPQDDYEAFDQDAEITKQTLVYKNTVHVYPNLFSDYCNITYKLNNKANVSIRVYDLHNRFIKNLKVSDSNKGDHLVQWDGTNSSGRPVKSGIYILQFETHDFIKSHKVILNRK